MLELIQKIKLYTEAGIILEHMVLFDELVLRYEHEQITNTMLEGIAVQNYIIDKKMIDAIRTCENCKYHQYANDLNYCYKLDEYDFEYCSKWEKK